MNPTQARIASQAAAAAEALSVIRHRAVAGRFVIYEFSEGVEMVERRWGLRDVLAAIASATHCKQQVEDNWLLEGGCDREGRRMFVVAVLAGDTMSLLLGAPCAQ